MRKTKKEIIYEDVEIIDAAAEGMSIAKVEGDEPGSGMVVFVPFVVPGDVIDLKVFKKKKNYAEGRAIAIKKPSPKRAELQCPHFGTCGGCKWQNMKYEDQIFYKQKQVKDNLERLGHVDCSTMRPICGSENIFYYRNKLEYTFSTKRWRTNEEMDAISKEELAKDPGALGFHAPQLFDKVLNIDHCALQKDPSNAIRLTVRDYALENRLPFYDIRNHTGFLRNIVIRNSSIGEWMVVVIVSTGQDQNDTILGDDDRRRLFPLLDLLKERFLEITSLQYIVNNKFNDSYTDLDVVTYHGKDHIVEEMEGYKGGKTLRFVYDDADYGTKGSDWFSVAEAEATASRSTPSPSSRPTRPRHNASIALLPSLPTSKATRRSTTFIPAQVLLHSSWPENARKLSVLSTLKRQSKMPRSMPNITATTTLRSMPATWRRC